MEQAPKETPSSDKKEVEVPVNVSRRDFLKGAGVGMVGAIAGVGWWEQPSLQKSPSWTINERTT